MYGPRCIPGLLDVLVGLAHSKKTLREQIFFISKPWLIILLSQVTASRLEGKLGLGSEVRGWFYIYSWIFITMAGTRLRDSGFMGRVVDDTFDDFERLSHRFSAVAERRARLIALPTSAQDVSLAVKFASRFVHALSVHLVVYLSEIPTEKTSI